MYADGSILCDFGRMDLDGLRQALSVNRIALNVAEGTTVTLGLTARMTAATPSGPPVADEDFVREVADQIERLNGRPTSRELCRDAAEAFAEEPSHERWLVMQEAYLRVPAHLRP